MPVTSVQIFRDEEVKKESAGANNTDQFTVYCIAIPVLF